MQLYSGRVRRTSFENWPCSLARTVDLLGDWWSPLVLREVYFGGRRFEAIQNALGIGRNVLAQRLARFVDEGILVRQKYQDRPERYEYLLTEKGSDLVGVLTVMMRWGDRWLDRGKGPPLVLRHSTCDSLTHAEVVCANCREPLLLSDLEIELGPGFPDSKRARESLAVRLGGSIAKVCRKRSL